MIKTLTIALIMFGLIIFFLILALIGQLDDLCEYEKKIKKAIGLIYDYQMNDEENENYKELLYVLKGEDKE